MKTRKKEIIIIAVVLIIQTILYVICGINKYYIHMDEAYSLGLASYDKVEIQANEDFYNNWHTGDYYEDYLSVQEDEIGKYSQVYENQKNDVHPPLYYLLLRIAMGFSLNSYSKWPGIIINIILYMFITIVMYLILQKIFKEEQNAKEKSIILAFISSITIAALTNAIYIRMYALSALNILITTLLHIKLFESKKIDIKLLIAIGASALVGSLTHYYYLFYLAMLYLVFVVKYIKEKEYKNLIRYTLTMVVAGVASLLIFPYSIKHMFFGYRGQGVISKLTNIPEFLGSIGNYIAKINRFGFNNLLFVLLVAIAIMAVILICKKRKIKRNEFIKMIELPTAFYFILVAVASPWIELRYIAPICSLIFIIVIYYTYQLLKALCKEKVSNIIMITAFVIILISPLVFKIEPEVLFSDKKEIVNKLSNELNIPTLYVFNSNHNRFLDDILLMSVIDESYVAKNLECTESNLQNIFEGKDLSKGIIVFINGGQEHDEKLQAIKQSLAFTKHEHLKRLNACDVYYVN